MNQDEVVVDFLNSSKQKILDFNQKHESNPSFTDLLDTNRQILKSVEELSNFLSPCLNSNFQTSFKKYEDCVYINRNKSDENEISLILEKIQNETNDVLDFLENLHLIYNSLLYSPYNSNCSNSSNCVSNKDNNYEEGDNYKEDKKKKDNVLLTMFKRNALLQEKVNRLRRVVEENEIKIKELNNDKLSCKKELEKCVETLNNFKIANSEVHKIESRLSLYSNLSQYLSF